ncbi:unnamed protein product [Adineta ricciae]|uniref:TIR domain-containing protein n=1 Tax=Adineta ricciae TaxID=249248 RepID=A0A813RNG5_ADIRI|nr:unnamed protein product [Adineta ricciae]
MQTAHFTTQMHSDSENFCEIKQIYYKLIQFQSDIVDNVFQLNIIERKNLWSSILDLWIKLTKNISNVTSHNEHLFNDSFNIIHTLSQQLVESKSILDKNDREIVQKTCLSCLKMLNSVPMNDFLCKHHHISHQSILELNISLIMTSFSEITFHLLPNDIHIFEEYLQILVQLTKYMERKITSNEHHIKSIVERLLHFFWNLSDRIYFLSILIKINLPENVLRWLSYSNSHFLSLISIIHNLSRHDIGVDQLNQHNAIEIIKTFQQKHHFEKTKEIELLISMILAELSSPEQLKCDEKIRNNVLNELLQRTINAANNENFLDQTGFHISEFLAVMVKLFVVEENTLDYILCHAETHPPSNTSSTIQLFISLFKSFCQISDENNHLEQFTLITIINILWSISFQKKYLQLLINDHKEIKNILENLIENQNIDIIDRYKPRSIEGIRVAAQGIIHNTQQYSQNQHISIHSLSSQQQQTSPTKIEKPLVMISYSHHDKVFCDKLVDTLSNKQNLFDFWIDRNHSRIAGDLWELIASGIEHANVILCIISDYYFQSKSCRHELIYATDSLHKIIIPVILEDFKPKGWLGIRIPGMKYVRFHTIKQLDEEIITDLLETILSTLPSTESSDEKISHLNNQLSTKDEIDKWFLHHHISIQLRDLYDFQTEEEIIQYGKDLIENYDKHWQIYSNAYMKKFNGEQLLPHEFQRFSQAIQQLIDNKKIN